MNPARILASMTPVFAAALLGALANMPVSLTGGMLPSPVLSLAPVFFWTLLRPDLMPPVAVLALGLWEDFLSGGPPGLWACGFLAAYALADRQRDTFAGLTGLGAVVGFAAAMSVAAGVAYFLDAIVYQRLPPPGPLIVQSLVTVILYPPLGVVLGWVHRGFVGALRHDD